jgi:hypothetical protein
MGNTGSDLDPNLTKRKKQNDAGRKEGEGRKIEERETIDKGKEEMEKGKKRQLKGERNEKEEVK